MLLRRVHPQKPVFQAVYMASRAAEFVASPLSAVESYVGFDGSRPAAKTTVSYRTLRVRLARVLQRSRTQLRSRAAGRSNFWSLGDVAHSRPCLLNAANRHAFLCAAGSKRVAQTTAHTSGQKISSGPSSGWGWPAWAQTLHTRCSRRIEMKLRPSTFDPLFRFKTQLVWEPQGRVNRGQFQYNYRST
jgi:hypothetical protein